MYNTNTILISNISSATATATTAGTTILVPSTATQRIHIKKLIFSNGATAGSVYFGFDSAAVAPTTTAIKLNKIYLAVNGHANLDFETPIILPASKNAVVTAVSCTDISFSAVYYVAP